jgi:hypothetical protein
MHRIDPARLDLVREFKARPLGTHSPELMALLIVMRSRENCGNYLLVCTRPHQEWTVAVKQPDHLPPVLTEHRFPTIEAAEWFVFKTRWEHLTGTKLEID